MNNIKVLKIQWQRLIIDGETCLRCGNTEEEVTKALQSLERSLGPLGIRVDLEKQGLDREAFGRDPSLSNRIWINGRLLEEWLDLKVGQSQCCGPCGEAECRTVEAEGEIYETVPASLIIKAGLMAAAKMLEVKTGKQCCPGEFVSEGAPNSCCPE